MDKLIINAINDYGYLAILLFMLIENVFPPIPSEMILSFGGFFTTTTNLTVGGVILFSTIGSTIGSIILYGLGKYCSNDKIKKWLKIKESDYIRMDHWFEKNGVKAIFLCRFIPLLRSLISLPAGMLKMNIGIFIVYTALGSVIWNSVIIYLGAFTGDAWPTIRTYFDMYSTFFYIVLLIIFIFIIIKWKRQ